MKELSRDFSEPETETLLDQLLVRGAANDGSSSWVSFDDVLEYADESIDSLNESLEPPRVARNVEFDLKSRLKDQPRKRWDDDDALHDRLTRRALSHTYSQRLGERDDPLGSRSTRRTVRSPGWMLFLVTNGQLSANSSTRGTITVWRTSKVQARVERSPRWLPISSNGVFSRTATPTSTSRSTRPRSKSPLLVMGTALLSIRDRAVGTTRHLEHQFGLDSQSAVPSNATLAELASVSHPRFTQRAHRVEYSQTRILVSEEYLGTTEKRKRRELEFLFREENYPHHLSSGPTMELRRRHRLARRTVTVWDTPNMNAYLQRVGRAGRSSHSSLVHSVSQRNPIDYYYYDHPRTSFPLNRRRYHSTSTTKRYCGCRFPGGLRPRGGQLLDSVGRQPTRSFALDRRWRYLPPAQHTRGE